MVAALSPRTLPQKRSLRADMKHQRSMRTQILGLLISSAAGVGTLEAAALPPILIGVSNVQSGPSRSLGQQLMQGSMSYFTMVNDHGGIHGRKITVVLKDDKYEPDPAIQNTNELITKDKWFFLFDYVGTPTPYARAAPTALL